MTVDDEDEMEFSWPKKGDKLFAPGDDWENNACVNHLDSELAYVEGYYLGGDKLIEYVLATKRDQDFLVYPITFVYRHYLELSFKRIRRMGFRLLDGTSTPRRITDSWCSGPTAGRPSRRSGPRLLTVRT